MGNMLVKNKEILFDDTDADFVNSLSWHVSRNPRTGIEYVKTNIKIDGKYYSRTMHRLLLSAPKELDVDHINRNTLDNRRSNLRLVTQSQNSMNMKMQNKWGKGVYKNKLRFTACIRKDGKKVYIGHFSTPQEAQDAYDKKAIELFGEFALTNKMIRDGYR